MLSVPLRIRSHGLLIRSLEWDNSFSRIAILSQVLNNSFSRIAIWSLKFRSLDLYSSLSQISICSHDFNIQNGLSKSRERMVIRENGLWKSRKRISIRENELSESRERFITRANGLSYSGERNTNRIALRHYNLIKIRC